MQSQHIEKTRKTKPPLPRLAFGEKPQRPKAKGWTRTDKRQGLY